MFKASDYRISPFELESVLIEHPAVAEAAVVPSPDALKLAVPKTISGKIRRVELRRKEEARAMPPQPGEAEYFDDELRGI